MKKYFLSVFIVGLMGIVAYTSPNVKVYMEQGGAKQVISSGGQVEVLDGGSIEVQSGGTLDLQAGSTLSGAASAALGAVTATSAAVSGAASVVGTSGIAVSTSASSSVALTFKGAVVTLSTRSVTEGSVYYQTSDYKLYIATRTWGENVSTCAGTVCYAALN